MDASRLLARALVAAVAAIASAPTAAPAPAEPTPAALPPAVAASAAAASSEAEAARRPLVIVAIGDSITAGITRSGRPGGGPGDAQHDPDGGYPGRLQRALGDGVRVLNRGAGGATTRFWLDPPGAEPQAVQAFAQALWPDFRPTAPPRRGQSLLSYVVASERPDVVLLLVGVNDLAEAGAAPADPAAVAARIERLAAEAHAGGARVLVGTLLPNRRDPPQAIAEVDRLVCAAIPDCAATGEAFAAAGGASLLGDEVHPGPAGHAAIAQAFADALAARGVVGGGAAKPQGAPGRSPAAPPRASPPSP